MTSGFTHFFRNFFLSEKAVPQTFSLLECMVKLLAGQHVPTSGNVTFRHLGFSTMCNRLKRQRRQKIENYLLMTYLNLTEYVDKYLPVIELQIRG